jgi:capsid protein
VVTIAAVLLWLLLCPAPAPEVVSVRVETPAGPLHCGQTADLIGVVTTDGQGGPVTYQWLRADGQDSGELVRTAHRGERRVRVYLRWTVRGPGRFRGTARLRIAHQPAPMEAKASFTYVCP